MLSPILWFCIFAMFLLSTGMHTNWENRTNVTNWTIERFFHLSDIHLDPYYNANSNQSTFCRSKLDMHCSLDPYQSHVPNPNGQFGCDTPEIMFNSSLSSMLEIESAPAFILISGDVSGHCMNSASKVLSTINLTLGLLRSTYPNTSLFPTIGNNDIYPHNTLFPGPSEYLDSLANVYESLMGSDWTSEINATFRQGGYYAAYPLPGIRIIALSTQYWYIKWVHGYLSLEDPANQFAWLESQLMSAYAANEQVLFTGHVPPVGKMESTWETVWVKKFLDLLSQYPPNFYVGMFFGHLHRDQFSIVYENGTHVDDVSKHMTNLFTAPSYTPRDLSNPAFRIFSLNYSIPTNSSFNSSNISKIVSLEPLLGNSSNHSLSTLLGFTQYYFDLYSNYYDLTKAPVWELQYNFTTAYGINITDLRSMGMVYTKLSSHENSGLLENYIRRWTVQNPLGRPSIPKICWLCTMTELMPINLNTCLQECAPVGYIAGISWWLVLLITMSLVALLVCSSMMGWLYYTDDKKKKVLKNEEKPLLSTSTSNINM